MGWETLAVVGFQAIQGGMQMNAAEKGAKAIAEQGAIDAKDSADNTVRATGKLTTNFLQSGLTLEGGPMEVLSQAFSAGYTNINRIASNANNTAKAKVNEARSKALAGLVSAGGSALAAGASDFSSGFSNGFNNAATFQTGATPGFGTQFGDASSFQSGPLPWSV